MQWGECIINAFDDDSDSNNEMSNNSNNDNGNQDNRKRKRSSNKCGMNWINKLELTDYKREFKHTNVPHKYTKNKPLGEWVSTQRKECKLVEEGKPSPLTNERINLLNKLGFVWRVGKEIIPWDERLQQLVEFNNEFNHTNVPCYYTKNKPLGRWVSKQRTEYKLMEDGKPSKLTKVRINLLNKLGFVWRVGIGKGIRNATAPVVDAIGNHTAMDIHAKDGDGEVADALPIAPRRGSTTTNSLPIPPSLPLPPSCTGVMNSVLEHQQRAAIQRNQPTIAAQQNTSINQQQVQPVQVAAAAAAAAVATTRMTPRTACAAVVALNNNNNNNKVVPSVENCSMELLLELMKQSARSRRYMKECQDQNPSSFLNPKNTTNSSSSSSTIASAVTATTTTATASASATATDFLSTARGSGSGNGNSNDDGGLKLLSTSLDSSSTEMMMNNNNDNPSQLSFPKIATTTTTTTTTTANVRGKSTTTTSNGKETQQLSLVSFTNETGNNISTDTTNNIMLRMNNSPPSVVASTSTLSVATQTASATASVIHSVKKEEKELEENDDKQDDEDEENHQWIGIFENITNDDILDDIEGGNDNDDDGDDPNKGATAGRSSSSRTIKTEEGEEEVPDTIQSTSSRIKLEEEDVDEDMFTSIINNTLVWGDGTITGGVVTACEGQPQVKK